MRHPLFITLILLGCSLSHAQMDERQRILAEHVPAELPMTAKLYQVSRMADVLDPPELVAFMDGHELIRNSQGALNIEIVLLNEEERITTQDLEGLPVEVDVLWRNRASVHVAATDLGDVARHFLGRALIEDVSFEPRNDQGASLQNVDTYIAAGRDGTGIGVAVIDYGFDSLSEAMAAGDVPSLLDTTSATGSGLMEYGGVHGTACLEAVYDNAPGSTLSAYRINGGNGAQFGNAVNTLINDGINVISISLGPHNEGWGDDTGPYCQAVNSACNAGLLVFVSAGNEARKHWQGDLNDNGTGTHIWNSLINDTTQTIVVADSNDTDNRTFRAWLQWDAPTPGNPYDLFLFNDNGDLLASSASSNTFESLVFSNMTPNDTTVHLVVRANTPFPPEFEIFSDPQSLEHRVPESSIESPGNATHPNCITVGAVHRNDYTDAPGTDPITNYSSLGPTNDGALCPDIAGVTSTTTTAYGGNFGGTSCSTPNAAGAAAALWSAHPDYTADGIRQLLLRKAELFKDWGPPGTDMTYGHGGLFLKTYEPDTEYILQGSGNTTGTNDIPYSSIEQADQYAPTDSRVYFLGGTFTEPPPGTILDTPMIYRSLQEDAQVE